MSESKVVWHSIKKEGLSPNDCDVVLVSMQALIGVFEEGDFEKSEFGEKYAQVTHWAYLLEPPKED